MVKLYKLKIQRYKGTRYGADWKPLDPQYF